MCRGCIYTVCPEAADAARVRTSSMDIAQTVTEFVVTYKWWFIAVIPFVIAIIVLKAQG